MEQQPIIETKPMHLPTCLDEPVTLRTLRRWSKANTKWAMLTCYDATTARWMAEAAPTDARRYRGARGKVPARI